MSKKLLDILPTLKTFQDNVITQLTNMFNGVEWLNDTTSYTKQETIYKLLILKYGDRQIRYDDENIFLNRLVFDLADFLPDIYAKQQVFIKNKLNEFLSDNKNRAVIIDNTSTNNRNTDNNTKFGNSSSPLNLVISNANEITNAPITSLNLSNVKLLENYNGTNQQVNYNFVNDLIKTLNTDYSLRLNEFMELLGKHFISVVGGYYRNQNDIQTVKDEPYRFNNGYLVNEVDYLCTDNKEEINRFNEKLGRLNDQVATKQNQLTAGSNISINNNVISANIPQTDLSNYYTKQEIDTKGQNYIEKNGNLQIVNAFVDFYGNIVAKNNGYVDNVDTRARTSMINKEYLEQQLNPINTSISANTNNITTNQNNITNLENRYTTLNNEAVKVDGGQRVDGAKTFTGCTTFGTEINAGWGGNPVKFIPDDSRTKTLQFYNNSGTDPRRFNLLISEPSQPQSPATKNYVDNLNNQNVKLAGQQEISGKKIFTAAGEAIQIKPSAANGSSYIAGYDGTSKKWVIGNTGQNNDMLLEASAGNINLKAGANGNIQCYNKLIRQVADPTNDTDGANKRYVHNFINYKEQQATISTNNQAQINPTSGYQVISVRVGRKRASDGYFFFEYNAPLNFQSFIHPNGKFTVYNSGTPSGFTNDFKFYIIEKKV